MEIVGIVNENNGKEQPSKEMSEDGTPLEPSTTINDIPTTTTTKTEASLGGKKPGG